jgi:hypothetical protein
MNQIVRDYRESNRGTVSRSKLWGQHKVCMPPQELIRVCQEGRRVESIAYTIEKSTIELTIARRPVDEAETATGVKMDGATIISAMRRDWRETVGRWSPYDKSTIESS